MSLPRFSFTDRARPFLEIGVGDSRVPTGLARWDVAKWDAATTLWAGTEPTWLDYTCESFGFEWEIGRPRATDRFVVGQLTVQVDNATGWADPQATSDPAQLTMRPGRAIRIGVDHSLFGRIVLFRGFIDAMRPTYTPSDPDHVTFSCIDALGEINRAKFAGNASPVGAGEYIDARIARIAALANWPPSKLTLDTSTIALVGDELNGQAADLIGRAADSGGGVVYGDREGSIVYHARDWQTYRPDAPLDGTIGNVDPAIWVPAAPATSGYLRSTGSVSTPDTADLAVTGKVRLSYGVRYDAMPGSGFPSQITKQGPGGIPEREYLMFNSGSVAYFSTADATGGQSTVGLVGPPLLLGVDHTIGIEITTGQIAAVAIIDGVRSAVTLTSAAALPNTTAPIVIGGSFAGQTSRIYWAQLERLDASGNVTGLVWRFDANDYYGTGTSYTDPRGRIWTLSAADVIAPGTPAIPAHWAGDVCPTQWVRPFDRADIATRAIMGRDVETAVVLDDPDGQIVYGIEPFERTDLWTQNGADLLLLANRVLRVRSWQTAPLVRGVSLDARIEDIALDAMTQADPYKPSRYRCRLLYPRGLVFDGEYFVTGLVHRMTPDEWSADLQLDTAAPYAAQGGRWDGDRWDRALWTVAV